MPKVKVPRKSTAIDMTAMCDVAILLLTFFILTTKFRPSELAPIDIPSSKSEIPIPDKGILKFEIASDGRIFVGVDDQPTRLAKRCISYFRVMGYGYSSTSSFSRYGSK